MYHTYYLRVYNIINLFFEFFDNYKGTLENKIEQNGTTGFQLV